MYLKFNLFFFPLLTIEQYLLFLFLIILLIFLAQIIFGKLTKGALTSALKFT
jgi:hypothetical protein